jgi:hypothetical protein
VSIAESYRQPLVTPLPPAFSDPVVSGTGPSAETEAVVTAILDDCVIAVGQAVGMRMTVDADAVIFLRDHFREKFLAALQAFGNRWDEDRDNVTGVAMLMAERAVRHAGDRGSVDLESMRRAAADVERHCTLHSRRAARSGDAATEGAQTRIAGYWCTEGGKRP